jgi:hypothetical protein
VKKTSPSKKLPAPLGLALTLLGLFGGVIAINRIQVLSSRASLEIAPQQLKITNIGSSSFVVSWTTAEKTTGSISFWEIKEAGEIAKDSRDREKATFTSSSVHFVPVEGLKPQTKYFFKIISGGKSSDDSGKPFEVFTATNKVPSDNDLAFGRILTPDGRPANGVLVYLSLANTLPQAALTDQEGNWLIVLSNARTPNLQDFSQYDRNAQIEEIIVRGEEQTATATVSTGNDSPVPDITLGQTYNFLNEMPALSPTPTGIAGRGGLPVGSLLSTPSAELELTITSPSENEEISSGLPEFFGTGPEDQKLQIQIESDQKINSQTTADTQGKWSWSPQVPLSPGEHRVTISYINSRGILQKVSRSFIVLAAGESNLPSFTATPSGQTVTPTATPTTKPKITPTVTPKPTATPLPTKMTLPATESAAPTSGHLLPTKIFLGAGAAAIFLGAILLLL